MQKAKQTKSLQTPKKSRIRVNVYFLTRREIEQVDRAAKRARRSRSEFIAEVVLRAAKASESEVAA